MAVVTTQARKVNVLSISYETAANLSNLQYCAVAPSGAATGRTKITTPSGQGVLTVGILQTYNATSGTQAEVLCQGLSKAKANASFNSGSELTVNGATGELEAAASGDYVIAIAMEASTAADQLVTVWVVSPYQKN